MIQESIYDRLTVFGLAIKETYGVDMWCFSRDFHLYFSTAKGQETLLRFLEISGCRDYVMEIDGSIDRPLILQDMVGMTWVAENAYDKGKPELIILMGPVFKSTLSEKDIIGRVAAMNISVELKARIRKLLDAIPIIPLASLISYTQLLHYMMTEKKIKPKDFLHKTIFLEDSPGEVKEEQTEDEKETFHADTIIKYEKRFLDSIRSGTGDPFDHMEVFSPTIAYQTISGNDLRDGKNSLLILCALSARVAMEGGSPPKTAKQMEIQYLNRIEGCREYQELQDLSTEFVNAFTESVQESKMREEVSLAVRMSCDYIRKNLTKSLSPAAIAEKVGYTEYYFSKKFRQEMGIKLSDYIKQQRIEFARQELLYSDQSIEEICDLLHFGNRSYFSKVFRELTGMTPAAYRAGKKNV